MGLDYRNAVEMELERVINAGLLNINDDDTDDVISDVICKTLGDIKPLYIRHHIDYSYAISLQHGEKIKNEIISKFNTYISEFRNQKERDWS